MRKVPIAFVLVLSFLSACMASDGGNEKEFFSGLYISYEEAEYEGVFVECGSESVWLIVKDNMYDELEALYKSSELSRYDELLIKVEGKFTAIDKKEYPNSHYVGEFTISHVLNHSSDLAMIDECRSSGDSSLN